MSWGVRGPLAAWFLAGCGLVAAVQVGYLARHDWDATILLQVGAPSPARRIVERELGPVAVSPGQGHDGKYFYLVARHPWFWTADPDQREGVQDPAYRYGRPLYPLLAGLGGTLPPFATFAGLVIVQVLAGGLSIAAVSLLARHNGLPTLAVVAAFATPCLYSSAVLLTSDLLALALTFLGVYYWQRGRLGGSVALFAAAVLAKEYYALTPLVLAATTFRHHQRQALAIGVLPLLPVVAWRVALAAVFGGGEGGVNFSVPGEGMLSASGAWENPALGAVAVLLVAASLAGAVRSSRPFVRWQCAVWGLLGLCASRVVWFDPADILRVISPAWWFAIWCWWPLADEK